MGHVRNRTSINVGNNLFPFITFKTMRLIEKVHLDDLDLYVVTFIALAMSVLL